MKRNQFRARMSAMLLAVATVLSLCMPFAFAATQVTVKTDGYYSIKNVGSGKYLNVYGNQNKNNANVDIYTYDGTTGMIFQFTLQSDGIYTITPKCATGRRLNVYGEYAYNKANVCLWSATGDSTQGWVIEAVSGGFIIRSANNKNYVLTATGSKNSSNVNIQKYSSGNKYQIWTSDAFSTTSTSNNTNTATASVSTIKTQITNTYTKAKSLSGRSSFDGWCGTYVYYQLRALGITTGSDKDCNGNGNQWYDNVKTGKTSTGYTKTKFSGSAKCLANLVAQQGNVQNVVISYPYQYGGSYSNRGAGHVVFIHAVIDGTVYYSECFNCRGQAEGTVLTYSVAQFDKAFSGSYGNALGAIWFHK